MTLGLLRLIESSSAFSVENLNNDSVKGLYEYSVKNRMPTSFLEKFTDSTTFPAMKELAAHEQEKYLKMLNAVSDVSHLLERANIRHAMFKTIRPYRSTTVDIDTIVFGNHGDYCRSLETLKNSNYVMLAHGPMSATFWDNTANIGIDIYDEIAVSGLCYIDKNKLTLFSRTMKLANRAEASLLAPEADLLAIVAHSIIKEQMYTLSEYYSFIKYLGKLKVDVFLDLLKETNLTNAARTHASITALLFNATHRGTSEKLHRIVETLGQDDFETSRILRRDLQTPHKYHPITLGKSLLEIAKGKKSRTSIAMQLYKMTDPTFTSKFLYALLQHVTRETY
jgi:hypothetical protein